MRTSHSTWRACSTNKMPTFTKQLTGTLSECSAIGNFARCHLGAYCVYIIFTVKGTIQFYPKINSGRLVESANWINWTLCGEYIICSTIVFPCNFMVRWFFVIKAYCLFIWPTRRLCFTYCRIIIKHISSLKLIKFKFIKWVDINVEMMYTTVYAYSKSNSICVIIITAVKNMSEDVYNI